MCACCNQDPGQRSSQESHNNLDDNNLDDYGLDGHRRSVGELTETSENDQSLQKAEQKLGRLQQAKAQELSQARQDSSKRSVREHNH